MLRIRCAQMDTLSMALRDDFVRSTARHLEESFPEDLLRHGLTGDSKGLVERGIQEAESYGITESMDVRLYVECMVILQPDFATAQSLPWAVETLRATGLSGTERMDRIHDHLVFAMLTEKP